MIIIKRTISNTQKSITTLKNFLNEPLLTNFFNEKKLKNDVTIKFDGTEIEDLNAALNYIKNNTITSLSLYSDDNSKDDILALANIIFNFEITSDKNMSTEFAKTYSLYYNSNNVREGYYSFDTVMDYYAGQDHLLNILQKYNKENKGTNVTFSYIYGYYDDERVLESAESKKEEIRSFLGIFKALSDYGHYGAGMAICVTAKGANQMEAITYFANLNGLFYA